MTLPYRPGRKKRRAHSYILIGDGFDELEVVLFLHRFRRAGLPIKSVSLFNKLVTSRQGVGLQADYALADQPFDPLSDCLWILPAGGRNGEMLRRDARVKSLLQAINEGRGTVAVTDPGSILVDDVCNVLTHRPAFRPDSGEDLVDFVEALTARVM